MLSLGGGGRCTGAVRFLGSCPLLPRQAPCPPHRAAPAVQQVPRHAQRWHGRRQLHASAAAASSAEAGETDPQPPSSPVLNWKVGVVLAGASFEAYNDLREAGIPERHEGDSLVYYIDRDFVREKLAGMMRVTVRGSTGLEKPSEGMLSAGPGDQWCSVSVGDSACRMNITACHPDQPDAHESCTLFIRDVERQSLTLRLMGADSSWILPAAADTYLGSAVQDLRGLCDGEPHELELTLRGGSASAAAESEEEGGQEGEEAAPPTIRLHCRFLPFSSLAAQEAASSEMGAPVVGTPGQIPLAADWRELLDLAGIAAHAMLTPVAYVEHTGSNTQLWLYWNRAQRIACVAFRGTEHGQWRDILTDLHLVPAPLDPDRVAAAPRRADVSQPPEETSQLQAVWRAVDEAKQQRREMPDEEPRHVVAAAMNTVRSAAEELQELLARVRRELEAGAQEESNASDQPWVHSGFLTAYDTVRPAVLSLLSSILEGEEEHWQVYLTGHSLGGALATLCAWDCSHRSWPCEQQPQLSVYNFGSPRVGNRAFADDYNRRVPSTWRIVNDKDTVCTVPRLMGYAHVGHAVHLRDGKAEVELNSTERLGEGIGLPDVAPAVGAIVQATVAAKVPDLLPAVAAEVLEKVGIEVATGREEAALAAEGILSSCSGTDSDGSGYSSAEEEVVAAALAVGPEHLSDLWNQELQAWSLLLDGSALDDHMEPLYLQNLKAYLHGLVEEEQRKGGGTGSNGSSDGANSTTNSSGSAESVHSPGQLAT